MKLNSGDRISIDGIENDVEHTTSDGYWLNEKQGRHYFYAHFKSQASIDELHKAGRLKLLSGPASGTSSQCYAHVWKKYVGVREVYDFCVACGEKKHKDWKLIKDDKEY